MIHNIKTSWWAEDLIEKVVRDESPRKVKVVIQSLFDLGFRKKILNTEVYKHIESIGGNQLSSEAACLLRLAYLSQPKGDEVHIAMDPIRLTDGAPMIFKLANTERLELTAAFALPGQMTWLPETKWAFEVPV